MFKLRLSRLQWLSLFTLTVGLTIQRVDWADAKSMLNSENEIRPTPIILSPDEKHNSSILKYIMDRFDILWVLLQVIIAAYTQSKNI